MHLPLTLSLLFLCLHASARPAVADRGWGIPSAFEPRILGPTGWQWSRPQGQSWWGRQPLCDLGQAHLPPSDPALPEPTGSLVHVAIGRGTQNYTCDISNATAVPSAVGAVASLYNASCIAAIWPEYLSLLPAVALQIPVPTDPAVPLSLPKRLFLSGHHFFTGPTSPVFDLDTALADYGIADVKKVASVAAPPGSPAGQDGQGFGSVAWLYLTANAALGPQSFQQVYRVNTAGGQPPKTCQGQPAELQVQYAAEYWFYA